MIINQGLKKVPSSCPGQVDFPHGQVTLPSELPNRQGPRQGVKLIRKEQSKTSPGLVKSETCLFEGQAGSQVFFFGALIHISLADILCY